MILKNSRTLINLGLDVMLAIAFLVSLRPFLTGLAVHEGLGLAIGAALIAHMVLHRRWIAGVTKKLRKLPAKTRLYYVIDVSLAIVFATILLSGVAMSRAVLPLFGLTGATGSAWFVVHKVSSYLTLLLVGIKLGLHYKWFAAVVKELGHLRKRVRNIGPAAQISR